MAAHGSGGPMTDPVADREIQAMLAVDPSPAFLPRVRARIADEPRPAPWWMSWRVAAVVSAAALAIVAARLAAPHPAQPSTAVSTARLPSKPLSSASAIVASIDGRAISSDVAAPRSGNRSDRDRRPALGLAANGPAPRTPDLDVLLDPRESAALRALIFGVRSGTLDLEPIVRASIISTTEPPPVGDIAIPPITIDPLGEGARP